MVLYTCRRCGYSNKIKTHMKKHFMRQTVCSPSLENVSIDECYKEIFGVKRSCNPNVTLNQTPCNPNVTLNNPSCNPNVTLCNPNVTPCNPNITIDINSCRYCNKLFNKRQHKWRHEKICKEKPGYTTEEVNQLMKNKDDIIDELKKQIEKLLTKVGNTTNHNHNTINITINAFGKENINYIKEDFVKRLITKGVYSAIPKLLKEIHFNPEHKENCNVMIPSRKEKFARRYNGEKWEFADKTLTLEDMSDKAFNILTEYGSGKKFDKFYDDYDDRDTGLLKKMKKDTEMMILNNQSNEIEQINKI